MNAVLAIALGLAPAQPGRAAQQFHYDPKDYAGLLGSYRQLTDRNGTTHLRGFDRITGKPFDLSVEPDGRVAGTVGEMYMTFTVREAA
jgi:hypothetical protein